MPPWFGFSYPTHDDLIQIAASRGVPVVFHYDFDVPRHWWDDYGRPWCIGVPAQFGPLAQAWGIAHEVGHMILHGWPARDAEEHRLQEAEADRWASCALIPQASIDHYKKPCVPGFVAALKKHYQNPMDDGVFRLAVRIAHRRLECIGSREVTHGGQ